MQVIKFPARKVIFLQISSQYVLLFFKNASKLLVALSKIPANTVNEMSFPRAAIKRFNEPADNSIPPPGAYDPKFVTDVSVASTLKMGNNNYDKWGRPTTSGTFASGGPLGAAGVIPIRSRSSSVGRPSPAGENNELRFRPSRVSLASNNNSPTKTAVNNNNGRLSRDTSFSRLARRRSSTTGLMNMQNSQLSTTGILRRRSNARLVGRTFSKSQVGKGRSPSTIRTNANGLRRAPSSTYTFTASRPDQIFGEILKDKITSEGNWNPKPARPPTAASDKYREEEDQFMELEPGEVYFPPQHQQQQQPGTPSSTASLPPKSPSILKSGSSNASMNLGIYPPANIFDEIQQLAESLQNELSEYKLKLGRERIRSQELEAKKLELEFINHSLKRQMEKYVNSRESWEMVEVSNKNRVDELTRERDALQAKLDELQKSLEGHEDSEFTFQEKIAHLEQEKMQWSTTKHKLETLVEQLQDKLKEEETRRIEVEGKIRELEGQMETCYHTCESRMADSETMKETYEVKIQELNEQLEELRKTLDATRRELETQKTLMELMKREKMEEFNKLDNYIS